MIKNDDARIIHPWMDIVSIFGIVYSFYVNNNNGYIIFHWNALLWSVKIRKSSIAVSFVCIYRSRSFSRNSYKSAGVSYADGSGGVASSSASGCRGVFCKLISIHGSTRMCQQCMCVNSICVCDGLAWRESGPQNEKHEYFAESNTQHRKKRRIKKNNSRLLLSS